MKLIQLQKEINPKSNQQIKVFYVQEISPVSETSTPRAVGQELNLEKDWQEPIENNAGSLHQSEKQLQEVENIQNVNLNNMNPEMPQVEDRLPLQAENLIPGEDTNQKNNIQRLFDQIKQYQFNQQVHQQ